MKRLITGTIAAAALVIGLTGSAFGASGNQTTPGTPGTPDCVGQTNAFLAQVGTSFGIHGIGGIADDSNLTVQQVEAIVQAFCAQ